MNTQSIFDNRLRPAVEFVPAFFAFSAATLLYLQPDWFLPILKSFSTYVIAFMLALGLFRFYQGTQILRYRSSLNQLPRYVLSARHIPTYRKKLFLGRGFKWTQRHSQRLIEARSPLVRKYLQPGLFYRWARQSELLFDGLPGLSRIASLTSHQSVFNPVRPLPEVGGNSFIHGVGLEDESNVLMNLGERVGHALILGTTRVGKTRFAEILMTQDIRRGDTVIFIDPKGDFDVLARMIAETKRAERYDQFHVFHLGHPEISERYNGIGDFGRITEVAGRIANQLPSEGNSAAFREFAWRFTNIVARALTGLGRKPSYELIARYVTNIEPLMVDYYHLWLEAEAPSNWRDLVQSIEGSEDLMKKVPIAMKSRGRHAVALLTYVKDHGLFDAVADGLRSAIEYDKTYFDKLTASLLPLMEKLTSGPVGKLLSPDYDDLNDHRPVLDWMNVIREGGVVYIGLDALSDADVASAVGNSMFADLTSIAGRLYKHGHTYGLPNSKEVSRAITIHADEFNELVGNEFIPMINKAGGAGLQMNAYTQTVDDIEAGIGSRAKAGQVIGNFNTLFMLRVKNEQTARVLTDQLPQVRLYTKVAESRTTDNNDPGTEIDFVSQNSDRLSEQDADMVSPADLVALPKGQAFALIEGGQLYKLRLPLPGKDPLLPRSMDEVYQLMSERY
ncbi:MAG: type IV conjugative transfer system coupling protein TraD [Gammaproteobacteria bacterium]|nr:type IV conjugative transfer system coupling protein TraD [Gammaproteobacteria bacterium]